MEASVSQDGTQATAAPEAQAPEGTQAAPQQQVPDVVTQRLDEISGRFDRFEPLLQNLQPQQEQQEEQGYEDFVDPETGYVIDPEGLQGYIDQQARAQAEAIMSPLQGQMQQMQEWRTQEAFADLTHQYPQMQDADFQKQFVPQVEQAAQQVARSMGLGPEHAQKLALDRGFVELQYLAGLARQQAQQGVPAGDQGVHIEGGTGQPGQPEPDAKQGWMDMAKAGSSGTPWGRDPGQL